MKKLIIVISIFLSANSIFAQGDSYGYEYKRKAVQERSVINWPYLREGDVMYFWRVERIIDVREKMNTSMAWPKNPLSAVLETAIMKENSLKVYWTDSLDREMTLGDIEKRVNHEENIQVQVDPNDPYNLKDSTVAVKFKWDDIKRFKIMEDWIFDKKESRMVCRIIYVAPMFMPYAAGVTIAEQPICYIKYHDNGLQSKDGSGVSYTDTSTFRQLCVNQEVYNRNNDAARMTYDDFFEQRMFSSYIIKQSNEFDLRIREFEEYKDDPIATLLKSDEIKQKLFETEHDLWEY